MFLKIFVQQQVCQLRLHNIDELKQRLPHVWHVVDKTISDNVIDKRHERLWACLREKRGLRATIVPIFSHMTRKFQFLSNVTQFLDCFCNLPQI